MREKCLTEIYRSIKKARDERLSRALSLLSKKAADPEIAEVLALLRLWAPGQGQLEGEDMSQRGESLAKPGGNQSEIL